MDPNHGARSTSHLYAPIVGTESFRTLHLQPALDASAPLRFKFGVHSPDSDEEYEAISYTWGEPTLVHPVYLDDRSHVKVTKNLDGALRRFRDATKVRILWADAICINQRDNEEKSTQIPLMARIFRNAQRVLAWLDGGVETERGMRLLGEWSRIPRHSVTRNRLWHGEPYMSAWDVSEEDCVSFRNFLGHAWFTRLWM